jgi:hypothetical protein
MKDYHVTLTVKNNHLFNYMQMKGINTVKELSRQTTVSESTIGNFLNLQVAPMGRNRWKPTVLTLAEFFKCQPEDLFPPQHIHEPMEKNKASFEMSSQDVTQITSSLRQTALSPEVSMMIGQSHDYLHKRLQEILDPRSYEIIKARFGLDTGEVDTLDKLGKRFKVAGSRIRQIELKALKKLRFQARPKIDPHFSEAIKTILGFE